MALSRKFDCEPVLPWQVDDAKARAEELPNRLPRSPDELAQLEKIWVPPQACRLISAVTKSWIGLYYIAAAMQPR